MVQKTLITLLVLIVGIGLGYFLIVNTASQEKDDPATPTSESRKVTQAKVTIEDLQVGEGAEVKSGDTVVMHYVGVLENGKQFDSSYDRGEPFETSIGTGNVIKGWDQGVPGMKVGGKRKLTIPSELGYGEAGAGADIPPNSTLVFEVELLEIK